MGYLDLLKEKEREKELLREKALTEAERLSKLLREKFQGEIRDFLAHLRKELV